MIKIILCKGVPGSGKSTWAKFEVSKDPENWCRINNDSIRLMLNNCIFSKESEKLVRNIRKSIIKEVIKSNKSIIIDNVNCSKENFDEICLLVESLNIDCEVYEKTFYIDVELAIERDSLRSGSERVGQEIIRSFNKKLGGRSFKDYVPKIKTFKCNKLKFWQPMQQDINLPKAVVFDNDGTICLMGDRSPYDASKCDILDKPHNHVIDLLKLYHSNGYKILFVSGRDEKDKVPTERFYQKHFPEIQYELYMRPLGDMRKDVSIKEEIFNNFIKNKYYVSLWVDDRLQICKWLYSSGFPLARVNDPEATF